MPRVSVIMASYNHAPYVGEAVASVFSQSYGDLELVVTDDGSSDGTADVVRACRDPRMRFHAFAQNKGACVAANDAIDRARGEYVAVLNSDDYFLPGKLEKQVAFLDAHPEIGAVFGLPVFVDERGRSLEGAGHAFAGVFTRENGTRTEWLRRFFRTGNCLCHPTVMLRRSCYQRVGRFDPLLMQLPDLDFWIRLCCIYDIHVAPDQVTAMRLLDRELNTSAPSPAKLARAAWEMESILRHFVGLPESILGQIVPSSADGRGTVWDLKIKLALDAIRIGRPGHIQFGLGLLRDRLREDPEGFSHVEYFRLVAELDPCGVQYLGKEFQILRRSRLMRAARAVKRLLRTRGFRG